MADRYIEINRLCEWLKHLKSGFTEAELVFRDELIEHLQSDSAINVLPVSDVKEVKHGSWLKTEAYPHRVYCSLCFKTYVTNEEAIQGRSWGHQVYCTEAEYCPHCGEKMDGEQQKEGAKRWLL